MTKKDSLYSLFRLLYKKLNSRTISFLKKHNTDYFSFWWFQDQVVGPSFSLFKADTLYLRSLKDSLYSTFPGKLSKTEEAQKLIAYIDRKTTPPPVTINSSAPPFKLPDINGKIIQLSDFKGKYVLLDFWASWCPPCRKNNSILKQIHDTFPGDKLEIISITSDMNINSWKAAVKADHMEWVNLWGYQDSKLYKLYGTEYGYSLIPYYVLIDPSGKIEMMVQSEIDKIQANLSSILKLRNIWT